MKLLNDANTDLSNDVIVQLAVMLECIFAAEIVCYRISDAMVAIGQKATLFQRKRQAMNEAGKCARRLLSQLEIAFDGTFDKVFGKDPDLVVRRSDEVQYQANDILRLLLIYYSRCDGDDDKRKRMQKALMNFKPVEGIDINEILKFYKFDL